MKLKSEVPKTAKEIKLYCGNTAITHDAAYAHALVMAIETWEYTDDPNDTLTKAIYRRATELMTQWGYPTD
jgi:hypothetical protein